MLGTSIRKKIAGRMPDRYIRRTMEDHYFKNENLVPWPRILWRLSKKPDSERLVENVHMQGFRNWGPARRVGSPSEARTNPEE